MLLSTLTLLALPLINPGVHSGLAPNLRTPDLRNQDEEVQDEQVPDEKPIERLKEWPKLTSKKRVETDLARLRKASTEEMAEQALEALKEDGAMVAPLLLRALEKERDEDARERILEVLDAVVGAPHTRLLIPWFESKKVDVRIWTLRRAAVYGDAGLGDAAADAWKRVGKQKEPDATERYAAALCLVSTGDLVGLDLIAKRAQTDWKKDRLELRAVMETVRGPEATAFLVKLLRDGKRKEKSAALKLLAGCGTPESAKVLRPYLDSTDNGLRVDAINAARGIVLGEPPLDKLPVFEAIELAKKWLERV